MTPVDSLESRISPTADPGFVNGADSLLEKSQGARIKFIREDVGFTNRLLARRLNISRAMLQKIESDKITVPPHLYKALSIALGTSEWY
jgi:DNA-binding transcriptional regulator YiaG